MLIRNKFVLNETLTTNVVKIKQRKSHKICQLPELSEEERRNKYPGIAIDDILISIIEISRGFHQKAISNLENAIKFLSKTPEGIFGECDLAQIMDLINFEIMSRQTHFDSIN